MDKNTRSIILRKIEAASYEDPKHKSRVERRNRNFVGEVPDNLPGYRLAPEPRPFKKDPIAEQAQIDKYLKEQREGISDANQKAKQDSAAAITPELAEEIPNPYRQVLKDKGIDFNAPPISESEKERRRQIEGEVGLFSTVGPVQDSAGSLDRQYVDPYNPKTSLLHKYFGYYDKEKQEWHPTQYSYVLYYMSIFASVFGLEKYLDTTKPLTAPKSHPYKNKYPTYPEIVFPFKKDMEDRITKDFPNLATAMKQSAWVSAVRNEGGSDYIAPPAPDGDKRFSDSVQIRFLEADNGWTVKGPVKSQRVQSTYVPEESEMDRVTGKILSKAQIYMKLRGAIENLKAEISDKVIREVLQNNKELNFQRRTTKQKEMIRGAIINAINEIMSGEVKKLIHESDI